MTPFRQYRETIGWNIVTASERLNVNERTIRRWDSGDNEPPPHILAWLERLARFHERNPPPTKETRNVK